MPGVVRRVIQTPQRGSVSQVDSRAGVGETPERATLQGSGVLVREYGWCRTQTKPTTKGTTGANPSRCRRSSRVPLERSRLRLADKFARWQEEPGLAAWGFLLSAIGRPEELKPRGLSTAFFMRFFEPQRP